MSQLENELHTAAKLGQHLLSRHDTYMKEVERERKAFLAEIEKQNAFAKLVEELEANNRDLEIQNQQSMRENMVLLKRLETLNASLNDADSQNELLRINLNEAENTVGKLSQKVVKASQLEQQMMTTELEREVLEKDLAELSQSSRKTNQRYRQAQDMVKGLRQQLDEVAHAKSDHEKPDQASMLELVRTKAAVYQVEASASSSLPDTLQGLRTNNATLENDNMELQRVLATTQDEITLLREQLQRQQDSAMQDSDVEDMKIPRRTVSQELHQHHHVHYHMPNKVTRKNSRTKETLGSKTRSDLGRSRPTLPQHLEKSSAMPLGTPERAIISHGLCSPPSTKRRHRDSGYFSYGSEESARERSASTTQPLSPCADSYLNSFASSTPIRKHLRSNSHESIFNAQAIICSSDSRTTDRSTQVMEIKHMPGLRHTISHESVLDSAEAFSATANSLLLKSQSLRRPFPGPLQNTATSATVSMASVTAYNSSAPMNVSGSPRSTSYKALRSAAAAQKLSPVTQNPPMLATSQFWKRNSDKQVPTVAKTSKGSRWTSLVPRWNASSTETDQSLSNPRVSAQTRLKDQLQAGGNVEAATSTAIHLSGEEEELLRDALAL